MIKKIRENILTYICVILGLAGAAFFFFHFYPEDFLRRDEKEITLNEMEAGVIYTGKKAGDDIEIISGQEDFQEMYTDSAYATAEPKELIGTGVYTLKSWVDPYYQRRHKGRAVGGMKRKASVLTSKIDIWDDYNQIYLMKLPDDSYILAQLPPGTVADIRRGKEVRLPIGRKKPVSYQAQPSLTAICEKYDVSTKEMLYTLDDEWNEAHHLQIFFLRFGIAVVVFFAVTLFLMFLFSKIFRRNESTEESGEGISHSPD